ncbi:MAG: class I SAM-dependent methyltransferase [Acetobacter sp.]|nr:class I SAM-dependent methyltransferase [Bacteroides sp.]MCM1342083.1 class I SAM-dependent methyltransferase [Acetobacter sp.]MCM1434308.1 class I SAM-dependent methyltransferase [Clostridiales bacterium]
MILSKRLAAVAELVKPGSAIADIGTDHGYIPVYLYKTGVIKSAVAADINKGPLSSCQKLIEQESLGSAVKTRLSDGLKSISSDEYDTIIIAGMGGELIADILSKKDVRDKHIILNPMTHPEIARKYLYDNGFEIDNDVIVEDSKHHYSVFDAYYTGVKKNKSQSDYYLGNIKDFSDKEYFIHLYRYLKNKSKSGEDYSEIINTLEEII